MKQIQLSIIVALLLSLTAGDAAGQLLWKVTAPGVESRPSYLFGTHHAAPASVLDSVVGFNDALEAVDAVYGEIIIGEDVESQMHNAAIINSIAAAPADSTLNLLLTQAQLDSVQTLCDKYLGRLPVSYFYGVKPEMLSTMIGLGQAQAVTGFGAYEPIDAVIQSRAVASGKRVEGLETVEQQALAMFGYPIVEQAHNLMEAVKFDEESVSLISRLTDAYLAGDIKEILRIMETPEAGMSDADADRLINKRNADWLRILAGLLPAASIMIAVGAGHLPGEKGLIEGLRDLGFKVEPVEK